MYSYEDRIRAFELYIKLGKHVSPAICRLAHALTHGSLMGLGKTTSARRQMIRTIEQIRHSPRFADNPFLAC